eukprot:6178137-Pleurochrysis_carterae.AAC.2
MRLQSRDSLTLSSSLKLVWRVGGWRGLYKGLGATLALDLPFALVQFPLFEALRIRLAARRDTSASLPIAADVAIAGAVAGSAAAAVTAPLDVVRTRHVLGVRPGELASRGSAIDTAKAIYAAEGLRGFSRGLLPRTIYMGLGGIAYLGTYALCSSALDAHFAGAGSDLSTRRSAEEVRNTT